MRCIFDQNIPQKAHIWRNNIWVFVRGKRADLKIIDDSFDNWCIEHEEEINEILQPFIKIPGETREIKNKSIYMSSNQKELYD